MYIFKGADKIRFDILQSVPYSRYGWRGNEVRAQRWSTLCYACRLKMQVRILSPLCPIITPSTLAFKPKHRSCLTDECHVTTPRYLIRFPALINKYIYFNNCVIRYCYFFIYIQNGFIRLIFQLKNATITFGPHSHLQKISYSLGICKYLQLLVCRRWKA